MVLKRIELVSQSIRIDWGFPRFPFQPWLPFHGPLCQTADQSIQAACQRVGALCSDYCNKLRTCCLSLDVDDPCGWSDASYPMPRWHPRGLEGSFSKLRLSGACSAHLYFAFQQHVIKDPYRSISICLAYLAASTSVLQD